MRKMIIVLGFIFVLVSSISLYMWHRSISTHDADLTKICQSDPSEKLDITIYKDTKGKVGGYVSTPTFMPGRTDNGSVSSLYDNQGKLISVDDFFGKTPNEKETYKNKLIQLRKDFPVTNTITCN
jgi:hypothetical protein